MTLTSEHLTVLLGATVPRPASALFLRQVRRITVTRTESGRSGFQLVLAGREAPVPDLFTRVVLFVTVLGAPTVLIDGVVTHRELTADGGARAPVTTVTGEDLGVVMDREDRSVEYPAHDEAMIALRIIARYARHGLVPVVVPPRATERPLPTQRIPVQVGTDLAHLTRMADRFGHVFRLVPGPAPGASQAYWGPRARPTDPTAPALTVGPGPWSTIAGLTVRADGRGPVEVAGSVQDPAGGTAVPVSAVGTTRAALATRPIWRTQRGNIPVERFRGSGVSVTEASARAAGRAEATVDAVTATGRLSTRRYGAVLPVPGRVVVRGAGPDHDGPYRISRVVHTLTPREGSHQQEFTLVRDGTGSL